MSLIFIALGFVVGIIIAHMIEKSSYVPIGWEDEEEIEELVFVREDMHDETKL